MKEKIKELLGFGLESGVVATAVGCDISYVSQLLSDVEFGAEVQQLKLINFAGHASRDRKYDALEDSLLEKLEGMIPLIARPMELVRALAIINSAKRRATPDANPSGANGSVTVVNLQLPPALATQIRMNTKNQVLEVNQQSIASLPAAGVSKKLEELRARRVEATEVKQVVADDVTNAGLKALQLLKQEHLPVADLL